jgi:hypothetical protein
MNPAAGIQNRLKPVSAACGNFIDQVLCISGAYQFALLFEKALPM